MSIRARCRKCVLECGRYFFIIWFDLLCLLLVSLAMGGLYMIPISHRKDRLFPVWRSHDGTYHGPVSISYPYQTPILSSVWTTVICLTVPLGILLLFQIHLRHIWDFHAAVFGFLKALIAA